MSTDLPSISPILSMMIQCCRKVPQRWCLRTSELQSLDTLESTDDGKTLSVGVNKGFVVVVLMSNEILDDSESCQQWYNVAEGPSERYRSKNVDVDVSVARMISKDIRRQKVRPDIDDVGVSLVGVTDDDPTTTRR